MAQWENRRSKKLPARASAAVAVLQFGLLLDMAYAWRWKLHEFLLREAVALGLYEQRRVPQILALSLIALAGAVASAVILHRCRCMTGVALAFTGTLLSVGLWCCEWVSFHFLDSILYRTVGGVMLVSLLRIGFALIVCCGVWIDARSLRPVKLKS